LALLGWFCCFYGSRRSVADSVGYKIQKQGALPREPCFSNFDFLAI
jgi:hypothetical protein